MACSRVRHGHCAADGAASQVKVCGCVCRQSSEHTCPFSFLFSEYADEHYPVSFLPTFIIQNWLCKLSNRPVVDFSYVKSSGLCTHDLKGHKHKLSPGFNTSVIISIKMTIIVMMAVMGHFSANETDFIYFPEGDFKMVKK